MTLQAISKKKVHTSERSGCSLETIDSRTLTTPREKENTRTWLSGKTKKSFATKANMVLTSLLADGWSQTIGPGHEAYWALVEEQSPLTTNDAYLYVLGLRLTANTWDE
jgi:hypothetical protein